MRDHLTISINVSPVEVTASSRVRKDGTMTNSNIKIPKGTMYKIHKIDRSKGFSIDVDFHLPNRIPYGSHLEFESELEARNAGWNI